MENDNEDLKLKLDGSFGLGFNAHLTIVTADPMLGEKEVTYEVPYQVIDFKALSRASNMNLILGFRLVKIIPPGTPIHEINISGLLRGDDHQ
jgi:hypothetical protein